MNVKRFIILFLFLPVLIIASCKQENIQSIYKSIPAKYNYVYSNLRALNDTAFIDVKSNTGLIDQLSFATPNEIKKYTELFRSYKIPGAEDQHFYLEVYRQNLFPSVYNFYNLSYKIDFEENENLEEGPQEVDNYFAILNIANYEIINIKLSTGLITCDYPYEVLNNYNLNTIVYPLVYKINITRTNGISSIKTVYYTLTHGVIRFETISNEIFDITI